MNKLLAVLGVLAGLCFVVASVIYFLTPANALPQFMPGFDATMTRVHYKYGVAALLLAAVSFIFASFQSGQRMDR
ncbi:MAG: hypothetical protein Q8R30_00935 [bacterium]|nr:hypothetical protein [bacterium]MDZ4286094.1 hypothetical protein [Candidatus Sungbacteria bacterium]